jgi:hypothetical protein
VSLAILRCGVAIAAYSPSPLLNLPARSAGHRSQTTSRARVGRRGTLARRALRHSGPSRRDRSQQAIAVALLARLTSPRDSRLGRAGIPHHRTAGPPASPGWAAPTSLVASARVPTTPGLLAAACPYLPQTAPPITRFLPRTTHDPTERLLTQQSSSGPGGTSMRQLTTFHLPSCSDRDNIGTVSSHERWR